MAPLNKDVHELNDKILDSFRSKNEKTYLSYDRIIDECKEMHISEEILNNIVQSGLPLYKLRLKTGSIVILLRNLNIRLGLCNGTKLVVEQLLDNVIVCKILSGKFKSQEVLIPRITLYSDDQLPIQFKRKQFPLRLAFSLSISKSQGQSFERLGIYLANRLFTHGLLYVAMSRVTNHQNLKIFFNELEKNTVCNIVFKEVLI